MNAKQALLTLLLERVQAASDKFIFDLDLDAMDSLSGAAEEVLGKLCPEEVEFSAVGVDGEGVLHGKMKLRGALAQRYRELLEAPE